MKRGKSQPPRTRLRQLITEALVDAYTEEEQHEAFLVMLQDREGGGGCMTKVDRSLLWSPARRAVRVTHEPRHHEPAK